VSFRIRDTENPHNETVRMVPPPMTMPETNPIAEIARFVPVEEAFELAAKGYAFPEPPAFNAHIHLPPNFSAFETIGQAVDLAQSEGVRVLCASNYYDHSIYGTFAERCRAAGIYPLFGLEIICLIDDLVRRGVRVNDPGNPGKYYFCGKGIVHFDAPSPRASVLSSRIRTADTDRMRAMAVAVGCVFAQAGVPVSLNDTEIIERICRRHGSPRETVTIQERHIAQAYQEVFFEKVSVGERTQALECIFGAAPKSGPKDAVALQGEIRSRLMKAGKPAFVEEAFVNFEEATELILEMGGIPCYPTLADGADPMCEYETPIEDLIVDLQRHNVHLAEFIPIRNQPETLVRYATAMRQAGIAVTAGTEHNTLDLIPIFPTCLKGVPMPEEVRAIFWEGACVIVAHQYLVANGRTGFVDRAGCPNPDYPDADARIRAFAALGAALVRRTVEIPA
jgi:hypothetical protein